MLRDRRAECARLDQLLEAVRAGESRVLVLRGEPGVGKTELLDYVQARASGCRVARAAGVQSEMELAFAGLHQLCGRMLDRLEHLPGPQREALGTAFGLGTGAPADRFFVGLAVLSLLSAAASERPLVCLVDDSQWLDAASAEALAFVARRLAAESVALVCSVREPDESRRFVGQPELVVEGLPERDARALLRSVIPGPLDERVRDRIIAETRGNPLALMELPRGLPLDVLAGGFGLPDAPGLQGQIEESFRRRWDALPADARRLLLVAAVEPVGDPVLVWRAAAQLGIDQRAAAPARAAGLVEIGARIRFRHPLVRSALYGAASPEERQRVHRALADVTDPAADPDRRAWHRAAAAAEPDESIAQELAGSAGRAQARGGLAAAAAFLERAAGLTSTPAVRAKRSLAAAEAKHQAGALDAAVRLLAAADAGPLDALDRAKVDRLHAQIAFASSQGSDVPPLLLRAAKRLEPLDPALARETYLEALSAAMFVGHLGTTATAGEIAAAAQAAPRPTQCVRASDLLLDALAALIADGYAAGLPLLRRAIDAFRSEELSPGEALRWLWLAAHAATFLWDDEAWHVLSMRQLQLARDLGAFSVLPMALSARIGEEVHFGNLATAADLIDELDTVAAALGSPASPYGALSLAAWRGRQSAAIDLIESVTKDVLARREGMGLVIIHWATAVLYNGLGRFEEALAAAQQGSAHPEVLGITTGAVIELVEAAARAGRHDVAVGPMQRLAEDMRACGTDWALGIEARSRALLSAGPDAEDLYREAIERLSRTSVRVLLARTHLTYGEWLRDEGRRSDARDPLRAAHEMFTEMGLEAYAERTARGLQATGVTTARRRAVETSGELTVQEAQVARLARDGLSNPAIGNQLFISPRTVEYHLHKVFAKLSISSRAELDRVLAGAPKVAQPV